MSRAAPSGKGRGVTEHRSVECEVVVATCGRPLGAERWEGAQSGVSEPPGRSVGPQNLNATRGRVSVQSRRSARAGTHTGVRAWVCGRGCAGEFEVVASWTSG